VGTSQPFAILERLGYSFYELLASGISGADNMQVWIASVIIIFALAQFWGWLQSLEFSQPVLVLGGLLLAFVSNYDKRSSIPFWPAATPLSVDAVVSEAIAQPVLGTDARATSSIGDRSLSQASSSPAQLNDAA